MCTSGTADVVSKSFPHRLTENRYTPLGSLSLLLPEDDNDYDDEEKEDDVNDDDDVMVVR